MPDEYREKRKGLAKHTHEFLMDMAMKDSGTGLPNKRALNQYLEEQVEIAKRYNEPLCILMIDLNGFKKINDDTKSHQFGDYVLQAMADHIRGSDFMGRFGGDEFLVVLPGVDIEQAQQAAERILKLIDGNRPQWGDKEFVLGASIGIAQFGGNINLLEQLVDQADRLVYAAKGEGKKLQRQEHLLGSIANILPDGTIKGAHYSRGSGEKFEDFILE